MLIDGAKYENAQYSYEEHDKVRKKCKSQEIYGFKKFQNNIKESSDQHRRN